MGLDGKVSIITGGGRGMGSAIALRFAKEGAKVAVASRTEGDLEKVISEVEAVGGEAIGIPTDVSNEKDVKNLVDRTVERFGRIDILVNNAGIAGRVAVIDMSLEGWNRMLAVNLTGTFLCSKAVLPHMMGQKYGKIINISSKDLVIDIGSNDGNLLNNFKNNHRVLGITPEKIGKIAI